MFHYCLVSDKFKTEYILVVCSDLYLNVLVYVKFYIFSAMIAFPMLVVSNGHECLVPIDDVGTVI